MSEDNNNVAQVAEEGSTATVETQTPTVELSLEDAVSAIKKKAILGRDRIGEAMDKANNGEVSYKGEAKIEELANAEGLDRDWETVGV